MPIFQKFFLYLLSIFHPSFFEKQFIYLAAPGFSLGAQDLLSFLRHAGYLVVACGVQFPAAAAKSRQSCPTLCDPIDGSPPGSRPWDSPGKNTGAEPCAKIPVMYLLRDAGQVTYPSLHLCTCRMS